MRRATIAFLLALFFVGCSGFRGITFRIPTNSMAPTIKEGDIVSADPLYYKHSPVERGDVVVLKDPDGKVGPNGQAELYVKRVVGLGGDKIQIKSGRLYVTNNTLSVVFGSGKYESDYPVKDFGPVVVPQGEYFLVGDNLANSYDSRHWKRSTIRIEDIYGKATLVKDQKSGELRSL